MIRCVSAELHIAHVVADHDELGKIKAVIFRSLYQKAGTGLPAGAFVFWSVRADIESVALFFDGPWDRVKGGRGAEANQRSADTREIGRRREAS
jgi:hypothetical protein